jgi:D-alanyl-D-alanine dipeptidase
MPTATPSVSLTPAGRSCASAGVRWPAVVMALMLAACAHSPQAAVPAVDQPVVAAVTPRADRAADCQETPAVRAALQTIAQELQGKGLMFQVACLAATSGWQVQVKVVDGTKAAKVVRGPLADGHDVDMGTPAGEVLAGARPGAQGFSPDVVHNRDWLRGLMARHQFDNRPDAWWHFAQRGGVLAPAAGNEVATR